MPSIKLTISESAKLIGVDNLTIRRALKKNEIRHIIVQGRYKIDLEDLFRWAQAKNSTRKKMNEFGIGQFVKVNRATEQ
ncbi:MAG: excisionase family DNA-binding protein [Patescibacteria group bacterium]